MANNTDNNNNPRPDSRLHREDEGIESLDDVQEAQEETESQVDEANEMINEQLADIDTLNKQLLEAQAQVEKEKKEYLFLMAEFDNFRKRTVKEKSDIIKNAAESVLKGLLPIVDDFERGLEASASAPDAEDVRKGMELIYQKLVKYLAQNGVKPIDSTGKPFDPEFHEAIAMVPADDDKKGIVIDTPTKGYTLNDKVIRHAKVAVGQ
ncbi:MAG: nucleotide exchange factor GrpE [Muribaculaceae bacterium]|nr:nucleotide exchange factor GrpE [Muribaculaceae bacterium]